MIDATGVTETGTDDTSTGTVDEAAVTPIVAGEQAAEKPVEEAQDEKPIEFVDYDFDADVKLDEGVTLSDGTKSVINELGKKYNLPKEAAQEFVNGFLKANAENATATQEAQDAHNEKTFTDWDATIKKDFGADIDANKAIIAKAYDAMPNETGFKELLSESGLDRHPAMAKAFLFFGKLLSEDSMQRGEVNGGDPEAFSKYSDILPQTNVKQTTKTIL